MVSDMVPPMSSVSLGGEVYMKEFADGSLLYSLALHTMWQRVLRHGRVSVLLHV